MSASTEPSAEEPSAPRPVHRGSLPVGAMERIATLDLLRGFALLGVLLMNMQAFAMVFAYYMNPLAGGAVGALDFWCWVVNHVLGDQKFMTIFSMLFGAGIVLMTSRAEARTGRSAGLHYRRMFWLLVFGAVHGILIWVGDILFLYAICGSLAYLFRRVRTWILVALALLLLLIPALILTGFGAHIEQASPEELVEFLEVWSPAPEVIQAEEAAYRGNWLSQQPFRFEAWKGVFSFIFIFGWKVLGLMLLGMALLRNGLLSGARSPRVVRTLAVVGLGVGFSLAALGVLYNQQAGWGLASGLGIGSLFNYFGSLLASFGYVGLILAIHLAGRLAGLRRRLSAVGRMAFTNYIMHSLICTTIFYGHGLGLFGTVGRLPQLGLVIVIGAAQLWYSPLWLRHFRFGPLEWLWRTLTYGRRPAGMRIIAADGS